MAAIDLEDIPDLGDNVPSLFPPRLRRCMKRMAYLGMSLAIVGWLCWGCRLFDLALWLHVSAMAIGVSLHVFVAWYLWRH